LKTYGNPLPIPDYPIGRNFPNEVGKFPAWRAFGPPSPHPDNPAK
jgi:hypothetical protein